MADQPRLTPPRLPWALSIGILLLAACGTPTASPQASASAQGSPTSLVLDCGSIELRTPGGQRIDLTGTWEGSNALLTVRHYGACVWWVDESNLPGEDLGSTWIRTFVGRVAQEDLTVTGEWADVDAAPVIGEREGRAVWSIDIETVDGVEEITLRRISFGSAQDDCCGYPTGTLTRVP